MEVFLNKPYPKIQVERKNIYYAKLLLEDYSGINGELSAICQYIYQKFDKFNENYYLSETLSKIARVEMHHLELLGQTIKLLGLNPKFITIKDYCPTYWNSSFLNYSTNISEMLIYDIKKEQEAIKNYLYHISLIDDQYIKKLLYRIIEDEKIHIKCFFELLKQRQVCN